MHIVKGFDVYGLLVTSPEEWTLLTSLKSTYIFPSRKRYEFFVKYLELAYEQIEGIIFCNVVSRLEDAEKVI